MAVFIAGRGDIMVVVVFSRKSDGRKRRQNVRAFILKGDFAKK